MIALACGALLLVRGFASRPGSPEAVASASSHAPPSASSPAPLDPVSVPPFCRSLLATPAARLTRILGTYRWHVLPKGGTGAFLADGRAVTGGWDKRVRVWDARGDETTLEVGGRVFSLAPLPGPERVAVGLEASRLEGWDLARRELLWRLADIESTQGGSIRRIVVTKEPALIAVSDAGRLACWSLPASGPPSLRWTKTLEAPTNQQRDLHAAALSPDEATFVTGGFDGHLRFWSVASGELVKDVPTSQGSINTCFYTRDGARIFATTDDPAVAIVDARTGELEATTPPSTSRDAGAPTRRRSRPTGSPSSRAARGGSTSGRRRAPRACARSVRPAISCASSRSRRTGRRSSR